MATSDKRKPSFTVAVDAMGGDYAPAEVVKGAVEATQGGDVHVLLVGDTAAVEAELHGYDLVNASITLVPSEGVIQETEHPIGALRQKPKASVVVATKLVKGGQAQAVVSMGSTGAAVAAATLILGLLEGVERPAIGGPLLRPLSEVMLVFRVVGHQSDAVPEMDQSFRQPHLVGQAGPQRVVSLSEIRIELHGPPGVPLGRVWIAFDQVHAGQIAMGLIVVRELLQGLLVFGDGFVEFPFPGQHGRRGQFP